MFLARYTYCLLPAASGDCDSKHSMHPSKVVEQNNIHLPFPNDAAACPHAQINWSSPSFPSLPKWPTTEGKEREAHKRFSRKNRSTNWTPLKRRISFVELIQASRINIPLYRQLQRQVDLKSSPNGIGNMGWYACNLGLHGVNANDTIDFMPDRCPVS